MRTNSFKGSIVFRDSDKTSSMTVYSNAPRAATAVITESRPKAINLSQNGEYFENISSKRSLNIY